jgi:hypothetical protein
MHAVEGALALLERGQPGLQGGRAVDRGEQDLFVWRPPAWASVPRPRDWWVM